MGKWKEKERGEKRKEGHQNKHGRRDEGQRRKWGNVDEEDGEKIRREGRGDCIERREGERKVR